MWPQLPSPSGTQFLQPMFVPWIPHMSNFSCCHPSHPEARIQLGAQDATQEYVDQTTALNNTTSQIQAAGSAIPQGHLYLPNRVS